MTGKAKSKEVFEFLRYDGDYNKLKEFCPGGLVASHKGEDPVWILCGKDYDALELDKGDYIVKDQNEYCHIFSEKEFKEKYEVTE